MWLKFHGVETMTIDIPLKDKEIRTGQPIFVFVEEAEDLKNLTVSPIPSSTTNPAFLVALKSSRTPKGGSVLEGEFSVAIPGLYEVRAGDRVTQISVVEQKYMLFEKEFGIFSLATIFLVGGMVLWLKLRKKTTAGST